MSATKKGPAAWVIPENDQTAKMEQSELDAFNEKHGRWLARIAFRLDNSKDHQEFLMLGNALVALVGIVTEWRKAKEGPK